MAVAYIETKCKQNTKDTDYLKNYTIINQSLNDKYREYSMMINIFEELKNSTNDTYKIKMYVN